MPSESLFSRSVSGPVREATRKALPAERKQGRREEVAARKERQRAQAPAPTRRVGEGRKKYDKRTRAATVAQLDADLAAAPKPPAVEKKAPEASKAPSIFGLGEGSAMQTKGSVTAYRPKGDPYRYKYDAETQSFSVYNLDGTPVRENVSKGMSGYEDFLRHAGGGRTKYHGGSTSAPDEKQSDEPPDEPPASFPELDEVSLPADQSGEAPIDDESELAYGKGTIDDVIEAGPGGPRATSAETGKALQTALFGGNQPLVSREGTLYNNNVMNALIEGRIDLETWPRTKKFLEENGLIRTEIGADVVDELRGKPRYLAKMKAAQAAKRALTQETAEQKAERRQTSALLANPEALAQLLATAST